MSSGEPQKMRHAYVRGEPMREPKGALPFKEVAGPRPPSTLEFRIEKYWDGTPVTEHEPFEVKMRWFFQKRKDKPHKRVIKVEASGPLFDDPPPPDDMAGYCANLWDYECLEFFFANKKDEYLEVEVGPYGHWLVCLFDGVRKPFNKGENLDVEAKNVFRGNTWHCELEIPLAFFPSKVIKFNAYALHGSGDNRHYEAYMPVTDGTETTPDFHRLKYFADLDFLSMLPHDLNEEAYKDHEWGELWDKDMRQSLE